MGLLVSRDTGQTNSFLLPETYLVVGLGNVGERYSNTRHNVGFMALDAFHVAQNAPEWREKAKFKALVSEFDVDGNKVILAKPTTMMNMSGDAVQQLMQFYRIPEENLLVVYDELDLPFGTLRSRRGGGIAGHNGAASVALHAHDAFARIRIGIDGDLKQHMSGADFVLANFSKEEQEKIPELTAITTAWINEFVAANFKEHTQTL